LKNIIKYGKKWSFLSKIITGRNEHAIKYHFFAILRANGITIDDFDTDVSDPRIMTGIFQILEKMNTSLEDNPTKANSVSEESFTNDCTKNQWNVSEFSISQSQSNGCLNQGCLSDFHNYKSFEEDHIPFKNSIFEELINQNNKNNAKKKVFFLISFNDYKNVFLF